MPGVARTTDTCYDKGMNNGNARQSAWSQTFHGGRGDASLPCPAVEFGGHDGLCKVVHPAGIVLLPAGGWKAASVGDGWTPALVESYV